MGGPLKAPFALSGEVQEPTLTAVETNDALIELIFVIRSKVCHPERSRIADFAAILRSRGTLRLPSAAQRFPRARAPQFSLARLRIPRHARAYSPLGK
jgi:hypothetical protein